LTNPAGAAHQVIGVYDRTLVNRLGPVLQHLGQGRSLLVHGDDGLDELTVTTTSTMLRVEDGLHKERIDPKELGLSLHAPESLRGGDAQDNAAILRRVFDGEGGAPRDVVILNAAAALYAAGKARGLTDGLQAAARAIDSGKAREVLESYVEFTQRHRDET